MLFQEGKKLKQLSVFGFASVVDVIEISGHKAPKYFTALREVVIEDELQFHDNIQTAQERRQFILQLLGYDIECNQFIRFTNL